MQLAFNNITDFVTKRIALLTEFGQIKAELEKRLGGMSGFSAEEFETLTPREVARYFTLKELIAANNRFEYGTHQSHDYGTVELNGTAPIFNLTVRACKPEIRPLLDMLREAQDIPGRNEAWLIGNDTSKGFQDPDKRYEKPFNTRTVIEQARLADSLLSTSRDAGPRSGYGGDEYQTFASPKGFDPIIDFCTRYPGQFVYAIIRTPSGEFVLGPERERRAGQRVTHYASDISLKDANKDHLIRVGEIANTHLLAA